MQRQSSTKVIRTGMLLSALSVALGSGSASAAQEAIEVAFVENVSGRVVALAAAKPTLLDALDELRKGPDWICSRTANYESATIKCASISHSEDQCVLRSRGTG
jgi:hypothetical protein